MSQNFVDNISSNFSGFKVTHRRYSASLVRIQSVNFLHVSRQSLETRSTQCKGRCTTLQCIVDHYHHDKTSTFTHSRLRGASTFFLISFSTTTFFNASGFVEATNCSKQKVVIVLHLKKRGCICVKLISLNTFEGKIYIMLMIIRLPTKARCAMAPKV